MRTDEIMSHLRDRIHGAPAFAQLPPTERDRLTDSLDALVAADASLEPARAMSAPKDPSTGVSSNPARDASQTFGNLVDQVDFVGFTSKLLHGVFDAIVDSSEQQMKAYAEMLESVVMSTQDFARTHVSEADARSSLMSGFAGMLSLGNDGKFTAAPGQADQVRSTFGLDGLDSQEAQDALVDHARDQLAVQRQQMLATMVLMGINRIIVTDGQINAKVTFHIDTDAQAHRTTDAKRHTVSMQSGATKDTQYTLDPNYQGDYPVGSGEDSTSGDYVYKLRPGRYDIKIDAGLPPGAAYVPGVPTTVLNCPKWGLRYLNIPQGWTINFYQGDPNWLGVGGYPAIADGIPHVTYNGPLVLRYPNIAFNRGWHNFMIVAGPAYTTRGFGVNMSTSTTDLKTQTDAELKTAATMKGAVDIQFESQVFPLDKLGPSIMGQIRGKASEDDPADAHDGATHPTHPSKPPSS